MKKRFVRKKKAFTIIEFMLAMTFLAVMLMGITAITMRILEIYRKGLTMREINANGRDILNDLTRTVGGSPIVEHINPEASNGMNITPDDIKVAYRNYFNETMMTSNGKSVQAGGVFCTGAYSYVWNTAPAIESVRKDSTNKNKLFLINDNYYKFARFPDTDRTACAHHGGVLDSTKITGVEDESIVSLIGDNESDLALYDFVVLPATQNNKTGQVFYSGMFILATMRGGVNILSNGDFCTGTDTMYSSNVESTQQEFNYCAVNKFNFAVRASGQTHNTNQYGER